MKIAIPGAASQTKRYEQWILPLSQEPFVTLDPSDILSCDGLLLPGGGDITPAFFGEHVNGSRNIDTRLDILQLDALEHALRKSIPILGICKGMQIINVAFGGNIIQHLQTADFHQYQNGDQYHDTTFSPNSVLYHLYGTKGCVNSAHHQAIHYSGQNLVPIQWCCLDHCVEAIAHETLPILGVQWHPERLDASKTSLSGLPLLRHFLQLCAEASPSPRSWFVPS